MDATTASTDSAATGHLAGSDAPNGGTGGGAGPAAAPAPPSAHGVIQTPLANSPGGVASSHRPVAVGPGAVRAVTPQMLTPQMLTPRFPLTPVGQPSVQSLHIPPGMMLVQSESGQLLLIHQQALAQLQLQAQGGVAPRTATPSIMTPGQSLGNAILNRQASTSPIVRQGRSAPASLAAIPTLHRPAVLQSSGGAPVSGAMPRTTTQTAGTTSVTISKETLANVRKCKNFLQTLIRLASAGNHSTETAANVSDLVKQLLDAKLEPKEFTSMLYKELNSTPQSYLLPFLEKNLPTLRQLTPDTAAFVRQGQLLHRASAPVSSTTTPGAVVPAPRLTAPVSWPQLQAGKPGQTSSTVLQPQQQGAALRPQVTLPVAGLAAVTKLFSAAAFTAALKNKLKETGGILRDAEDINDVASMAGVNLSEESANILASNSGLMGVMTRSCQDEAFLSCSLLQTRMLEIGRKYGVTDLGAEVLNCVSHAAKQRLQNLLDKVSQVAQQKYVNFKADDTHERSSDVRAQLKFFEQLDQLEKQRGDEQEREILLKAAKSRVRQEDPEQPSLKQRAKEMQQQEEARMRRMQANLTALAAIGPRKKRTDLDSSSSHPAAEGSGLGASLPGGGGGASTAPRTTRQRVTRVNLRDLLFCLENDGFTRRSHFLYKGFLK